MRGQKRGKKCELKPFPKDRLEDAIILATVNDMLTDEMIEKLTVRILEVQEQENADDPVVGLRRRLDSNKKRQRNLLDAIEEGGAVAWSLVWLPWRKRRSSWCWRSSGQK